MNAALSLEPSQLQMPLNELPFHEWIVSDGTLWTQFFRMTFGFLLRFPELADFRVSPDGLSVACSPVPEVAEATIHHLYLNQVLPLMLSMQGKLVFHASAIEVAGNAVAFVAESGRGKSTLAASFAMNGFPFLTDDGLVVDVSGDRYQALPGHPSIRLWGDSEGALIPAGTQTALPLEFTSKARFLAGAGITFCDQPRPLQRVYFLGDGGSSKITFQRIHAAESLVEWVKHSFLLDVEEKKVLALHFDEAAKLAMRSDCYRLDYPRRYEDLAHLRQTIIEHATRADEVA